MANLSISKREILFLRSNILKKFCETSRYNFDEYCRKLTGTIKYYEEITDVLQEELQTDSSLVNYLEQLSEKSKNIFRKQFSSTPSDDRRIARECANSISPNVIRKLIFNGLSEEEQTYKNTFIYACYYYIGTDRFDVLKQELSAITKHPKGSPVTIKPFQAIRPNFKPNETNDVFFSHAPKPTLKLIPINNDNDVIVHKSSIILENESTLLNREILDPDNPTITSKIQAIIKFDDGKWVIENFSQHKTTYIQVLRPMELQKGDVITMGDLRLLVDE